MGRQPKVQVFQDITAIPYGADWLDEINEALDQCSFFIPILTPTFLQSEPCCTEVLRFRAREIQLGRNNLIFPLHYINTADVDPRYECHDPEVLKLLRARNQVDFRDLRLRDKNGAGVALQIAALARSIRAALRRGP